MKRFALNLWTNEGGAFHQPGCQSLDDALWHVNKARDHDGLPPMAMKRLVMAFRRNKRGDRATIENEE